MVVKIFYIESQPDAFSAWNLMLAYLGTHGLQIPVLSRMRFLALGLIVCLRFDIPSVGTQVSASALLSYF